MHPFVSSLSQLKPKRHISGRELVLVAPKAETEEALASLTMATTPPLCLKCIHNMLNLSWKPECTIGGTGPFRVNRPALPPWATKTKMIVTFGHSIHTPVSSEYGAVDISTLASVSVL